MIRICLFSISIIYIFKFLLCCPFLCNLNRNQKYISCSSSSSSLKSQILKKSSSSETFVVLAIVVELFHVFSKKDWSYVDSRSSSIKSKFCWHNTYDNNKYLSKIKVYLIGNTCNFYNSIVVPSHIIKLIFNKML